MSGPVAAEPGAKSQLWNRFRRQREAAPEVVKKPQPKESALPQQEAEAAMTVLEGCRLEGVITEKQLGGTRFLRCPDLRSVFPVKASELQDFREGDWISFTVSNQGGSVAATGIGPPLGASGEPGLSMRPSVASAQPAPTAAAQQLPVPGAQETRPPTQPAGKKITSKQRTQGEQKQVVVVRQQVPLQQQVQQEQVRRQLLPQEQAQQAMPPEAPGLYEAMGFHSALQGGLSVLPPQVPYRPGMASSAPAPVSPSTGFLPFPFVQGVQQAMSLLALSPSLQVAPGLPPPAEIPGFPPQNVHPSAYLAQPHVAAYARIPAAGPGHPGGALYEPYMGNLVLPPQAAPPFFGSGHELFHQMMQAAAAGTPREPVPPFGLPTTGPDQAQGLFPPQQKGEMAFEGCKGQVPEDSALRTIQEQLVQAYPAVGGTNLEGEAAGIVPAWGLPMLQ